VVIFGARAIPSYDASADAKGASGMGSPSTNAVALRKANSNAEFSLANRPRIPSEVVSPSSSKIDAVAINIVPRFDADG
jgi:hypothetical protein